MSPLPTALVVSNFPIIRKTAVDVLRDRYEMESITWDSFLRAPHEVRDLLIIDVTRESVCQVMEAAGLFEDASRVAVFSLDHNEIDIYRKGEDGPEMEAQLPSLLALVA